MAPEESSRKMIEGQKKRVLAIEPPINLNGKSDFYFPV